MLKWCVGAAILLALATGCRREKDTPDAADSEPPPQDGPVTAVTAVVPLRPSTFPSAPPGTELRRYGDEIMVAGRLFRTGTRVVLWTDPGGYDAYRTERRFSPWATAPWTPPVMRPAPPSTRPTQRTGATARPGGTPAGGSRVEGGGGMVLAFPEGFQDQPPRPSRVGIRDGVLNWPELEQVRGGGWTLELLQQKVDQFVIHYDAVGFARFCFRTLHDSRGLSVHFLLDIDGTIYQTMDLKDRAFHATTSNHRSIGIEIANRGAYESLVPLREFYEQDELGVRLTIPARFGDGGLLVPGVYRPARPEPIRGRVNGLNVVMYDFTPEQYDALTRLVATVATVLPRITLDYPKEPNGQPKMRRMTDAQLERWQGLIGHYNIQTDKYDPGPAFQWERVVAGAKALMTPEALEANRRARNHPVRPGTVLRTAPPLPEADAAAPSAGSEMLRSDPTGR
ncbi:MAG: N-acetylmuramoyl-L-alanine amidase [Tepidisphaerales bacterium]